RNAQAREGRRAAAVSLSWSKPGSARLHVRDVASDFLQLRLQLVFGPVGGGARARVGVAMRVARTGGNETASGVRSRPGPHGRAPGRGRRGRRAPRT